MSDPHPSIADLRDERDALDAHVNVEGDCQQQMFLGDCPDCERWHVLDDQIRAAEQPWTCVACGRSFRADQPRFIEAGATTGAPDVCVDCSH